MNVPLSKPYVSQEMKTRVLEVIDSGQYILGKNCKEFEKELPSMLGRSTAFLPLPDLFPLPLPEGAGSWTWGCDSGSIPDRFSNRGTCLSRGG